MWQKPKKNNIKKTTLFLFGALCLLCASCEKEDETDARDAIVGRYFYQQVGFFSVTKGDETVTCPIESIDLEPTGTFTIAKDNASTTGLKFDSTYPTGGWLANQNTLCFTDYKYTTDSFAWSINENGTITIAYVRLDLTIAYSPCKVKDKTFSTVATISGSISLNGEDCPITGQVAVMAESR